jgi:Fe2+ or Zn2+ uptake regulation protein
MSALLSVSLEEVAPRATRPSEIREALRDKGITMAVASIHFALSQLQARGAVEQITDTKTWRYLGKTE